MADNPKIQEYLDHSFPGFEPMLREKLVANGTIQRYPAGETLMSPGQYFRAVMLIVEGRVKLYRQGAEGDEY
ncbi:MAG TPA: cyclic nucleotide-binding domain-containing protein, partial [Sphingobacteriaceae bacterium]